MQNGKSLFMQTLVHYKTFTLWKKKQKHTHNDHIWLVVNFIKVFHKATTCPRQSLLSSPKSGRPIQV